MSRKTKRVRKLTKVGGYSYAITLPREIVKKFHWQEHQKLQLEIDEKKEKILIKDWEE